MTSLYVRSDHLTDSLANYKSPAVKLAQGGRKEALRIMQQVDLKEYAKSRDIPMKSATSKMSAHLKFGCVSIREFYWFIRQSTSKSHELIRQLYWKDFYANIAYSFPHVLEGMVKSKNKPFYDSALVWEDTPNDRFSKWCAGNTGFPIVDAGMREMNATGFMHNRLRMITASFLIKDLHMDWRLGEKYFATQLTDYDPCSNNGGWQWCAGTGTDSQPYYRVLNPWLQAKRFDPDCAYIKLWVPELASVPAPDIIKWNESYGKYQNRTYPCPMLDHSEAKNKTMKAYYDSKK